MPRTHAVALAFALLVAMAGLTAPALADSIPLAFLPASGVPLGTPVVVTSQSGLSAAQDWSTFYVNPNSTITTELLASTDTLASGGNMLVFSTDAGFNGQGGNGLFIDITPPISGVTGTIDINVAAGTSGRIGFIDPGHVGFASGSYNFSGTNGWQRISFSATGSTDEFLFEVFSQGGGSLQLANGTITPEPGTLFLLAGGLLALALLRRRWLPSGA